MRVVSSPQAQQPPLLAQQMMVEPRGKAALGSILRVRSVSRAEANADGY